MTRVLFTYVAFALLAVVVCYAAMDAVGWLVYWRAR